MKSIIRGTTLVDITLLSIGETKNYFGDSCFDRMQVEICKKKSFSHKVVLIDEPTYRSDVSNVNLLLIRKLLCIYKPVDYNRTLFLNLLLSGRKIVKILDMIRISVYYHSRHSPDEAEKYILKLQL